MEAASFEIREQPGEAWITVAGELDLAAAPRLQRSAERLLAGELRRLVLDLRGLRFIDSSGVRVVIMLHERAAEEGWELQLVRPPDQVFTIFRISGVEDQLHFIDGDAPRAAP